MKGGMLVTKSSTGTHLIEDIKVYVSHGEGTYIRADDAVSSSDLYRALNSGILMLLVDSMPQTAAVPAAKPEPLDYSREDLLEKENRELREALTRSNAQGTTLQTSLEGLQSQMTHLLAAVGRIEASPRTVVPTPLGDKPKTLQTRVDDASEDLPVFVPTDLIPTDAQVRINFRTETSSDDNTSEAVSKLRQLRRGGGSA